VGDSIASGIVMLGVLGHVQRRFDNIAQVEIVAPFATLRGLARLARKALLAPTAPGLTSRSLPLSLSGLSPTISAYAQPFRRSASAGWRCGAPSRT
jgi:hypothetical protein